MAERYLAPRKTPARARIWQPPAFAVQTPLALGPALLGGVGAGVGLAALAGGGMAGGGFVPFVLFGLNVLRHGEPAQEQGGGGKGGNAC